MRKIISVLVIIILIVMSGTVVNALQEGSNSDVEIQLTMPETIEEGTKTITATIILGKFVEVEENQPMGYEVIIDTDATMVENIVVTGLNDWTAQYSNNKIIGETSISKSNTAIAKIVLTLKDTVIGGEKISLQLKDMNITDAVNLDKTVSITKTTNILVKKAEIPTNEVEDNNVVENATENTTKNNIQNTAENTIKNTVVGDETVKKAVLPKAGSYSVMVAIAILFVLGIIGIIRYHSIETKAK